MHDPITRLVEDLASGRMDPARAVEYLRDLPHEPLGFARLDHHRPLRNGLPEVVFGQGKTAAQVGQIVSRLRRRGHPVLVTRLSEEVHAACRAELEAPGGLGDYDPLSRTWRWAPGPVEPTGAGLVGVVCAGTSDLPVAEEAARTLELFGNRVERVTDVGVAGLHRLMGEIDLLRRARVLVVVAGMEGALPSVVAGLVACPVIAVPTSVGYGASFGGLAALLAMLNSCAAGVTVVNIDNGFGAACAAHYINHPVGADAAARATGPREAGAERDP